MGSRPKALYIGVGGVLSYQSVGFVSCIQQGICMRDWDFPRL